MTDRIEHIAEWFNTATPEPTDRQKSVQLGVHFEEVSEMAHALRHAALQFKLEEVSQGYKLGTLPLIGIKKTELLDALCDQIVTAIGVAHMFNMDIAGALAEVDRANWSKFVENKPVFDVHGKIVKGPGYQPPQLQPFVNK